MEIKDVLEFTDIVFFNETGKHIDGLQEAILKGTLEGHKYSEIAQKEHCSEGHLRNIASELWQILSNALGEEVNKSNFRHLLKRSYLSIISSPFTNVINNVNFCHNSRIQESEVLNNHSPAPPTPTPQPQQTPPEPQINLGEAPAIFTCYGRTGELATLENWIIEEQSHLVEIWGLNGIGKTTLALSLIEQTKTNFDYIIYRSLCFTPTLETTLNKLLQNFCQTPEKPEDIETLIYLLLNYLRNHRCLIILDDMEMLFSSGQLAGEYQPAFANYALFFKRIAENNHKSCLVLISSEKIREFGQIVDKQNRPIHCLKLEGLGRAATEIFRQYQLSDEETWETLITSYQGHPLWLELTALMIEDLFKGKVWEFLEYEPLILCEALQAEIEIQFQRLALAEQTVMMQLAKQDEPVTLKQTINKIPLSTSELFNAMQSLGRRLLIDSIEQGKQTYFQLNRGNSINLAWILLFYILFKYGFKLKISLFCLF
ncbi:MAG: ATP-binding protein, partial [Nostocales cyanobacterium W4_Combined_metabat2_030]|nr:ATP-binding protein [Nostocales cyanobacterium W4_Combined_metabat2_030]